MKVTLERLPESRVQVDIEVEPERVQRSVDAAFRRLAPKARVPGFRPGKAPRQLIEQYLGRDRIMNEALDALVPDVYNEALESEEIDAIARPVLDGVELDPVRLKFIVPVRPQVDLDDYRSIRIERESVEVTPEAVEEQLLQLRRRHAVYVPVDRGAQWNDMVITDIRGTSAGLTVVDEEGAEVFLREGETLLAPGLAEEFIGLKKGDEKVVEIVMPDDFRVERLQGSPVEFTLLLKEVKEEQLPDLDDDFAQQVNAEEFPTVAALRERVRADLEKIAADEAESALQKDAVDKLLEKATIEYPRILAENEIDHMVRESTGGDQRQYLHYLQSIGRSESEFRETFREAANARVRRSVALIRLAELEGIEVTVEDIDEEVDRLVAPLGEESGRLREMFGTEDGRATIRRNLLSQRTLERLAQIVTGEVAEEGEASEGEASQELTVPEGSQEESA